MIELLKKQIIVLVEEIMKPDTPEEKRWKLGAEYEEKNKAYLTLGGRYPLIMEENETRESN
jgi:hypothetical protein